MTHRFARSAAVDQPDFERARRYAIQRLANGLSPLFHYHALTHTFYDVLPAVERLAALEQVDSEAELLLRTAAVFHDIGFVEQRHEHEAIGIQIAATILPEFGYRDTQIQAISGMILATRLPQTPRSPLEQLLADADLDVLGRDDFLVRNQALRKELAAFGTTMTDAQWYEGQINFLENHRYWSASARKRRDEGKQQNIARLTRCLKYCQE